MFGFILGVVLGILIGSILIIFMIASDIENRVGENDKNNNTRLWSIF